MRGEHPQLRVEYNSANSVAGLAIKQILQRRLYEFLQVPLPVTVQVADEQGAPVALSIPSPPERQVTDGQTMRRITMIMLCTLCIMVVSFNMFGILFSEEKAGRAFLAQLLSPAGIGRILLAKMIFFLVLSLGLLASVVLIYRPATLLRPPFWLLSAAASVSYMSLSALFVTHTRKQSTATLLTLASCAQYIHDGIQQLKAGGELSHG